MQVEIKIEIGFKTRNSLYYYNSKLQIMSTAELKIDLIKKIATITDEAQLKEILQFLSFQMDQSTFITTDEEKNAIAEAREQIKKGEVSTNRDVQNELMEWLKK